MVILGVEVGRGCCGLAGRCRRRWISSGGGRLRVKRVVERLAVQGEGLLEACGGFVNAIKHVVLKGTDTTDLVYKSLKRVLVSGTRRAGPCWGGRWPFC